MKDLASEVDITKKLVVHEPVDIYLIANMSNMSADTRQTFHDFRAHNNLPVPTDAQIS